MSANANIVPALVAAVACVWYIAADVIIILLSLLLRIGTYYIVHGSSAAGSTYRYTGVEYNNR